MLSVGLIFPFVSGAPGSASDVSGAKSESVVRSGAKTATSRSKTGLDGASGPTTDPRHDAGHVSFMLDEPAGVQPTQSSLSVGDDGRVYGSAARTLFSPNTDGDEALAARLQEEESRGHDPLLQVQQPFESPDTATTGASTASPAHASTATPTRGLHWYAASFPGVPPLVRIPLAILVEGGVCVYSVLQFFVLDVGLWSLASVYYVLQFLVSFVNRRRAPIPSPCPSRPSAVYGSSSSRSSPVDSSWSSWFGPSGPSRNAVAGSGSSAVEGSKSSSSSCRRDPDSFIKASVTTARLRPCRSHSGTATVYWRHSSSTSDTAPIDFPFGCR